MVHQYRAGVKSYVNGTGRRALWQVTPPGFSTIKPQFWIPRSTLSESVRERLSHPRVGFCDITGQTNERSMLAALVPAGAVCGNKVPTVTFGTQAGDAGAAALLWLAVANSLPFDWLLRRVVTTTVNYFLLLSMPFPDLHPSTLPGRRLVSLAGSLVEADSAGPGRPDPESIAAWRAEIDVRVAAAYGLDFEALAAMFSDFPLLDRGQPNLPGEEYSTITRDTVLARASSLLNGPTEPYRSRVREASAVGAVAYVAAQHVLSEDSDPADKDASL